MLKSGIDIIVPFLKHIFQYIFDNGIFPSDWSKSIIVPIHKKGDVDDCNNYRPISLTSLVSKIYTHILNQRLTKLATSREIIPEEQAAFRKKVFHCRPYIYSLRHDLKAILSKQKTVRGIY